MNNLDHTFTLQKIRDQKYKSEIIIAYTEAVLILFLSLLYALSPKASDNISSFQPSLLVFLVFFPLVASRIVLAHKKLISSYLKHFYCFAEMLLISSLIYSLHLQYSQPESFYLRAPTFLYYFVFVVLQAIHFEGKFIAMSSFWAIFFWSIMTYIATSQQDSIVTHSFTEYLYSPAILVGAEVEKCVALALIGVILVAVVHRYRLLFVRSINELRTTMAELDQRNCELISSQKHLQEANRTKSRFLTLISHELRTPINGILGTADLMNDFQDEMIGSNDRLRREYHQYRVNLRKSALTLRSTVDNILGFIEVDSSDREIILSEFEVRSLIDGILLGLRELMQPRVDFEIRISDDVKCIYGPREELSRCLDILLNNAFKFTNEGRILIVVERRGSHLFFRVDDTGVGIPPEQQKRIFEPFSQIDESTSRSYEGTGLGLAHLKKMVTNLNGMIDLISSRKGSQFSLSLPISDRLTPIVASSSQNLRSKSLRGDETILVVDDNVINLKITSKMVEKMGFKILTSSDGAEAIETIKNNKVDLVLMDCQMPRMDGYQATQAIRNELKLYDLPVVALTAHALDSDRKRCKEAGMTGHLTKPIQVNELEKEIKQQLLVA